MHKQKNTQLRKQTHPHIMIYGLIFCLLNNRMRMWSILNGPFYFRRYYYYHYYDFQNNEFVFYIKWLMDHEQSLIFTWQYLLLLNYEHTLVYIFLFFLSLFWFYWKIIILVANILLNARYVSLIWVSTTFIR